MQAVFSREQILQLMRQVDQSVMPNNMDDFTIHFCTQGDFVHCEVKREEREVELVVVEEDHDPFGGSKQFRFLRHKVDEPVVEPVGEAETIEFVAEEPEPEPVFEFMAPPVKRTPGKRKANSDG